MNPPVTAPTATRPTILPEDTYGLDPERNWRLIAKLRTMPDWLRQTILTPHNTP
jgi:hypothetical protein